MRTHARGGTVCLAFRFLFCEIISYTNKHSIIALVFIAFASVDRLRLRAARPIDDAQAILQRARVNNLKTVHIPGKGRVREEFDRDVTKALEDAGVDLVLLVGFMRIISGEFCRRWHGKLLNVHPSLLPLHAPLPFLGERAPRALP